jgi:hypothetical protein
MICGDQLADHAAHGAANDVGFVDAKGRKQADGVSGEIVQV